MSWIYLIAKSPQTFKFEAHKIIAKEQMIATN